MNTVERVLRCVTKKQARLGLKQKTYYHGVEWRDSSGLG